MVEPSYSDHYGTQGVSDRPNVARTEVVTIDGKKWLVGMRWRSYEAMPERGELALEAESMHMDWIARRIGDEAIQVGFCAAVTKGWPSKMYSLAALLADSHKVPWAGAFDLGDGLWWYIAVRDNYGMMPDGDVVGTYDDIVRARQAHASLEDFNHVNGTRDQLQQLIKLSKAKKTALESLTASRFSPKVVLGTIGVAVLLAVFYFGFQYYRHSQQVEREASVRQQIREQAIKAQQVPAPDAGRILRALPDPAVWLAACRQAVYNEKLWKQGWQLIGLHCADARLLLTWRRGPGATIAYAPPGAISDDGNSDVETVELNLPPSGSGKDDSLPLAEAHKRVILWAQLHAIQVGMTVVAPPPPKQNDPVAMAATALGNSSPPPVPSIQISFSVPAAPFALDFSEIPGLRLSDVGVDDITAKSNDQAQTWRISGVVYGR